MKTRIFPCFMSGLTAMLLGASLLFAQDSTSPDSQPTQDTVPPSTESKVDILNELKEKAQQGNASAMRELWMRFSYQGNQEESNHWGKQYVDTLTVSAEQGNLESMKELGKLYMLGSSLYPKNLESSRAWFAKAAEAKDPDSQMHYAKLLVEGIGGPADESKAAYWVGQALENYKKQASSGDSKAAFWVFMIYEKGLDGNKNPELAAQYLKKSAELGNLQAEAILGLKYKEGTAQIPQDLSQALSWFIKAADQHDVGAIMEVGMAYRDGLGADKDAKLAQEWFTKGIQLGDPFAMTALAKMLLEDNSNESHRGQAVELLQKASDIGELEASLLLVDLYETGQAGEQDTDKAFAILRRLVDMTSNPHPKAMMRLASMYYAKDDNERADGLVKQAANMGYVPAIYAMAKAHLNPFGTIPWNPIVSYYYLDGADRLGDADARFYANLLLYGGSGLVILVCLLVIWRFHRFAKRKMAQLDVMEKKKTK